MNSASKGLVGNTISRLAIRQFWLDGELSSPCAPLFIEDTDQACWKLWYDDETWRWQLSRAEETFPVVGSERGDHQFKWRDIEPEGAGALADHRVIGVETNEDRHRAQACVRFENGSCLKVTHDLKADRTNLLIEPGA